MRGFNKTLLAGNVSREIHYGTLPSGGSVLSFTMACDRRAGEGGTVTAWVKVNVYIEALIKTCRRMLNCGGYVIVEGELMNREGRYEQLTEVRAREIIFVREGNSERRD